MDIDYCGQCAAPIHRDDDACICIDCGGRNSVLEPDGHGSNATGILAGVLSLVIVMLLLTRE